MTRKFADIINEGLKAGKTIDEINAELKEAGANFHLDPDGKESGWTEEEMAEGFNPPTEPVTPVVHLHDCFGKNEDKAGQTVRTWTAEGRYDITYNERGYAVKAVRVNG